MLERMSPNRHGSHSGADIVEQVLVFLDHGVDPTAASDKDGHTALHLLMQLGGASGDGDGGKGSKDSRVTLLTRLLQCPGVHVNMRNANGQTPLHLLSLGETRSRHTWRWGKQDDNKELLGALLAAGADLNARDNQGRSPVFFLINSYAHSPSFDDAEMIVMCEALVGAGSRVDSRNASSRTLVHAAVERGSRGPPVQWLPDRGADPQAVDDSGNTLFHAALIGGRRWLKTTYAAGGWIFGLFDVIHSLGVDSALANHAAKTPLHLASTIMPGGCEIQRRSDAEGTTTVLDWLLGHHCLVSDVDVADEDDITPLHNAATFSEYMARRLIDAGADPLRRTNEGLDCLHLAARGRQANILGMMLSKLALVATAMARNTKVDAPRGTCDEKSASRNARPPLYYAVASGQTESVILLLDAVPTLSSIVHLSTEGYPDSLLHAATEFEQELKRWPQNREHYNHREGREVGSVLLNDGFRGAEGPGPRPSARLDDILSLLVEHGLLPWEHLEEAIADAVSKDAAYTVTCLLRVREQHASNGDDDDDDSISSLVEARNESSKPFVDAVATNDALSANEFHAAMQSLFFDVVVDGLPSADSSL